ncbi:WSC domain-containing protein, DUF1996 domain [Histoplasma capsulatum var. duboisii H88]|uniref:WSC domain-containing protein, DUF1996 domain n=1 Tax=Ajellomyces capsulatus (strain H88) TaxID=544711 RepID=A0A8A1LGU6_AJEC8|nr:WSC domain-containing protein, DUF1996 domain [Histoplasma capsulatum var. duboisii H88]
MPPPSPRARTPRATSFTRLSSWKRRLRLLLNFLPVPHRLLEPRLSERSINVMGTDICIRKWGVGRGVSV